MEGKKRKKRKRKKKKRKKQRAAWEGTWKNIENSEGMTKIIKK